MESSGHVPAKGQGLLMPYASARILGEPITRHLHTDLVRL